MCLYMFFIWIASCNLYSIIHRAISPANWHFYKRKFRLFRYNFPATANLSIGISRVAKLISPNYSPFWFSIQNQPFHLHNNTWHNIQSIPLGLDNQHRQMFDIEISQCFELNIENLIHLHETTLIWILPAFVDEFPYYGESVRGFFQLVLVCVFSSHMYWLCPGVWFFFVSLTYSAQQLSR